MKKIAILLAMTVILSYLYSLFNSKQEINWQFLVEDQVGAKSVLNVDKNLTFDDEFVYFSDGKNTIYSLNQKNGQINWTSKLNDHTPFRITQDDSWLYIASFDSQIYKLDKKNGYIVWSFAIPNQYWPDTEVFFDENDQYVFFADRGGFLYALEKTTGHEVWKKEFETIDNTRVFKEGSIHFGFLDQREEELVINHFPSNIVYVVDKSNGLVVSQEEFSPRIDLPQEKEFLSFDLYDLIIENNVIKQPIFHLFDQDRNIIWSYQTRQKINHKEIYRDKNRIYYLGINNQILSSIFINSSLPSDSNFHKVNFETEESFSSHGPFNVHPNPHIRYISYQKEEKNWSLKIKEKINYCRYLLSNLSQISQFAMNVEEKSEFLELDILHQDNFYKNKFDQVKISGKFTNNSNQEKVEVNGFYYDKNTWKLRVKLDPGEWQYAIKINTPFWNKKFKGVVRAYEIRQPKLTIDNKGFAVGDSVFVPLGLQDSFVDSSKDGNRLNKLGYAFSQTPATDRDDYRYLPLEDYLELYKNEAAINMFRYGPDNAAPSIWQNLATPKQFAMDIKGNLQGDFLVEEAKKREYRVMMSIFSFYPPHSSQKSFAKKSNRRVLEKYLDYVIARYAASVDIWEITNEAVPILEWQNFISDYLLENDPYKHPITTSLEESSLNNSELLSIHYVIETPVSNKDIVDEVIDFNSSHEQEKAKIISEFGFADANHFTNSADWLRKFTWIFMFQRTGIIFWNTGTLLYTNPKTKNSNVYMGPKERFYLKTLVNFLPPINVAATNKFYLKNEDKLAVYELEDENSYLFYLLNLSSANERQKLEIEIKKNGSITFIDPKTGRVLQKTSISKGEQKLSLPIFKDDLAIKIDYE